MRQRNKKWALPYLRAASFVVLDKEKPFAKIEAQSGSVLEIGVGKGDFIVALATDHPEQTFYGVEAQAVVLAYAARKVAERGLNNVVLIWGDASFLPEIFPAGVFTSVFLNFPDPWPKVRHAKRRLTSPRLLTKIDYVLQVGGEARLKTDNGDLFAYSLQSISDFGYKVSAVNQNDIYAGYETEYEKKFKEEGKPIYRLVARKEEERDETERRKN